MGTFRSVNATMRSCMDITGMMSCPPRQAYTHPQPSLLGHANLTWSAVGLDTMCASCAHCASACTHTCAHTWASDCVRAQRLSDKAATDPVRYSRVLPIVQDEVVAGTHGQSTSCTKGLLWLKRWVTACPPMCAVCCASAIHVSSSDVLKHAPPEAAVCGLLLPLSQGGLTHKPSPTQFDYECAVCVGVPGCL